MNTYPLSENEPQRLRTPRGLAFKDITLESALEGRVGMEDLRITPDALEMQAQIAEAAGRRQLAENLRRAAELASIPESFILEVYESLRPGRANAERSAALAQQLEQQYNARRCAALVREAAGLESDHTSQTA